VKLSGIRPSVRLSHDQAAARRCGGFNATGQQDRRYRSNAAWPTVSSSQQRRAAANAGSGALSADV